MVSIGHWKKSDLKSNMDRFIAGNWLSDDVPVEI